MLLKYLINCFTKIKLKHILSIILAVYFIKIYFQNFSNSSSFVSSISCKSDVSLVEIDKNNEGNREALLGDIGNDYIQLEKEFYDLMTILTLNCRNEEHLGPAEDGGYNVCLDPRNDIQPPCLIYSFGVGDDFQFEKHVVRFLKCEVHAFDPSMGLSDHKVSENIFFHNVGLHSIEMIDPSTGWSLKPLDDIITLLNHHQKSIDLLKMDIEYSEWTVLERMFEKGTHKVVRQLIIEAHSPEMDILQRPNDACARTQTQTLQYMLAILRRLKQEGFVLFSSRTNHRVKFESQITGLERYCCYNLHYVNTNHPDNKYDS